MQKHKLSYYFFNPITYVGAAIAFFVFGCELLLFAIDFFSGHSSVYLGLITYAILPPFLIIGLIIVPIGARRKYVRIQRGGADVGPKPLYVDLSIPSHRNAFMIFVVGTTVLLIMTMIGSYKAYHYTESVEFCGTT